VDFTNYRSLPEVADVMTRLDLNSELVMDKSALNDVEDQLNSSSSSSELRKLRDT
jgi:hypothetical protein